MDKEHAKGASKEAEGKLKKGIGKAVDNDKLEAEGRIDETEGKVRKGVGDVKDSMRDKPRH